MDKYQPPIKRNVMYMLENHELDGLTEMKEYDLMIYVRSQSVEQLLEASLLIFGTSLKSSRKSAAMLLEQSHMLPVMIDASSMWCYFPVYQQKALHQLYVNPLYFLCCNAEEKGSIIYFTDGSKLHVNQKADVVKKQYTKAITLLDINSKIRRMINVS